MATFATAATVNVDATTTANAAAWDAELSRASSTTVNSSNFGAEPIVANADVTFNVSTDFDITGVISGTAGIIKTGNSVLTLSGTNTYDGKTTITAGTLRVSAMDNLGATPAAIDADNIDLNGGILDFNGTNDVTIPTNKGVTISAASQLHVNLNVGTTRGGSLALDSDITGSAALRFEGGNNQTYLPTLLLNGNKAYTGTITSVAGTNLELVNCNISAPMVIGGDLKGTGTITGNVDISGGRMSPGGIVGSHLNITGNVTSDADTHWYFGYELRDGTFEHDQLIVSGTVTFNGSVTTVPYSNNFVAIANQPVIDATTLTAGTGFGGTFTSTNFTDFAGYADGNEDVTDGANNLTASLNFDTTNNEVRLSLAS